MKGLKSLLLNRPPKLLGCILNYKLMGGGVALTRMIVLTTSNISLFCPPEAFSVAEGPDVYIEGSAIYLEAQVQASSGILPTIFVDKCFGTDAKHWSHPKRSYVFVDNHGSVTSCCVPLRKGNNAILGGGGERWIFTVHRAMSTLLC